MGGVEPDQPVLIAMAVCLLAAVAVMVAVAVPRMLSGARVLSPVGRQLVRQMVRASRIVASGARRQASARVAQVGSERPAPAQLRPAEVGRQRTSSERGSPERATPGVRLRETAAGAVAVADRVAALAVRPRTRPVRDDEVSRDVIDLREGSVVPSPARPPQLRPPIVSKPARPSGARGWGEPEIGPRHRR